MPDESSLPQPPSNNVTPRYMGFATFMGDVPISVEIRGAGVAG